MALYLSLIHILVESEKTALVASYYLPQFLWIAAGGKNGCFNANSLSVLAGRTVVLFPDLGATDYWQSKIGLKMCIRDSQEALEVICEEYPDLVICYIMLKGMSCE